MRGYSRRLIYSLPHIFTRILKKKVTHTSTHTNSEKESNTHLKVEERRDKYISLSLSHSLIRNQRREKRKDSSLPFPLIHTLKVRLNYRKLAPSFSHTLTHIHTLDERRLN